MADPDLQMIAVIQTPRLGAGRGGIVAWSENVSSALFGEVRALLPWFGHWCYPTFEQLGPDPDCSEKKKTGFFSGEQSEKSNFQNIEAVIIES